MKKIVLILLSIGSLSLLSFYSLNFHMRSSGSPGANTGAPGQFGGRTCANAACHSGSASFQAGMISSDIPASGFIPGQTYTITGTVSEAGRTKFGFEISPQDSSGNLLGAIALLNNTETKFTNQNKSVTHTSSGNSGPAEMRSWSFSWTAPSDGTDNVTFWGAFNAANGDNTSNGDLIYTSRLNVELDTGFTTGISDKPATEIFLYPNPASDHFFISVPDGTKNSLSVDIYDVNGNKLLERRLIKGASKVKMDISELSSGNYILKIFDQNQRNIISRRIIKN